MQVGRRGTRAAALIGMASLSLLVSACGGSNSAAPLTTRAELDHHYQTAGHHDE